MKEQQGLVSSLQQQLDTAKQQYQQESNHSDDLGSQLRDKEAQLEEHARNLSERYGKYLIVTVKCFLMEVMQGSCKGHTHVCISEP